MPASYGWYLMLQSTSGKVAKVDWIIKLKAVTDEPAPAFGTLSYMLWDGEFLNRPWGEERIRLVPATPVNPTIAKSLNFVKSFAIYDCKPLFNHFAIFIDENSTLSKLHDIDRSGTLNDLGRSYPITAQERKAMGW